MPGWVGGVPAAGGDLHLHLLRSEVEGTGGCFLDLFGTFGFYLCVSLSNYWKPRLGCASSQSLLLV